MAEFDLVIIGGGINGAAIARDAAGRGLRVLLAEQYDLASGTSSASTKLIHGGLRYLEQGAFKLVHDGLIERARLLKSAPHLIWPARFVLPHHKGLRPFWQLGAGLFIYDMLGAARLGGTRQVDFSRDETGACLHPSFKSGFEYSDCCVDDARLVIGNALAAKQRGATVCTRTKVEQAVRQDGMWCVTLRQGNTQSSVTARALVNASGPWIAGVNGFLPQDGVQHPVKLVKGSHIVMKRMFAHDKAYIFQNSDGRIVFAIPYEQDFTLIGTTEEAYAGDPVAAGISAQETDYLCGVANGYFRARISSEDVVWSFAGVRALYDSRLAGSSSLQAKDVSRDFLLELDAKEGAAPLLSIYGGKLTAARHLAENAVNRLTPFFKMGAAWTGNAALPGGDFTDMNGLMESIKTRWPFLDAALAARMARAYGTCITDVLGNAACIEDMGLHFGQSLYEREVRYLINHEWAVTTDDVLWRRSKLGLRFSESEKETLQRFMEKEAA